MKGMKIKALAAAAGMLAAQCLSAAPVLADDHVYVSGVRADTEYVDLIEGDTYRASATVYPDDASEKGVFWRSDNGYAASVDNDGLIRANNPGYATVMVQTKEFGYADYVSVVVRKNTTPVSSISLSPAALKVKTGEYASLKPVVQPERAADKSVTWESADPAIAWVNSGGTVCGVAEGTTEIYCWSNSSGLRASAVVQVIEASRDPAWLFAASQQIMGALPGGIASFPAAIPMCFDRNVANAIKARPDVQVLMVFPYRGRTYSVALPPGYDLASKIGPDGYVSWADLAECNDGKVIVNIT